MLETSVEHPLELMLPEIPDDVLLSLPTYTNVFPYDPARQPVTDAYHVFLSTLDQKDPQIQEAMELQIPIHFGMTGKNFYRTEKHVSIVNEAKSQIKRVGENLNCTVNIDSSDHSFMSKLPKIAPPGLNRFVFHYVNFSTDINPDKGMVLQPSRNTFINLKDVLHYFDQSNVIYIFDCHHAGMFYEAFSQNYIPNLPLIDRRVIAFFSCSSAETIPLSPVIPFDIFTTAMTNPVCAYHHWRCGGSPTEISKSQVRHINKLMTSICLTMAYTHLDDQEFSELFIADDVVSNLFVGFTVASRILSYFGAAPLSVPRIPDMSHDFMWSVFDSLYDKYLLHGYRAVFSDIVTEFELKLELGAPMCEFGFLISVIPENDAPLLKRWVRALAKFLDLSREHTVFAFKLRVLGLLGKMYDLLDGDDTVVYCCVKLLTLNDHLIDNITTKFRELHVEMCKRSLTPMKLVLLAMLSPFKDHMRPPVDICISDMSDSVFRTFALHYLSRYNDDRNAVRYALQEIANFVPENTNEVLALLDSIAELGRTASWEVHDIALGVLTTYFDSDNPNVLMRALNCIQECSLESEVGGFLARCADDAKFPIVSEAAASMKKHNRVKFERNLVFKVQLAKLTAVDH